MAAKPKEQQQSRAPSPNRDRPQMVSTKLKKPKKTSRGK
jgi:hypothetical protein